MDLGYDTGHIADDAGDGLGIDRRDAKKVAALIEAARATERRLEAAVPASARYVVSRYTLPVALADGGALLFNARTRSLILLDRLEAARFAQLAAEEGFPAARAGDPAFLRTLAGGGHIVGVNTDELGMVRRTYEQSRGRADLLNLTIAPTMACNFACGYCYQGLDKAKTAMDAATQEALFRFIRDRAGLKSLSIVWYGGEPLMGREPLFRLSDRLIAHCDKKGIAYSAGMVSNSHLLTPEVAHQLYSRRIKWVQATLDGDRETHDRMRPLTSGRGTYDTILRNLQGVLDETPISINLRVNVGRHNVERVSAMLDELDSLKLVGRGKLWVYFAKIESTTPEAGEAADHLMPRDDFNRAVLGLEAKARALKFAGTVAPSGGFSGICVAAAAGGYVVAANGDLHKCWETMHDKSRRIGSLHEPESAGAALNGAMWRDWSPFDNPVCSACRVLPLCGGHCEQRFVYWTPDQTASPCPSWKWNTAEYVFSRAVGLGVVKPEQWLDGEATALTQSSGAVHDRDTLGEAHAALLAKVGTARGLPLDRETFAAGESALGALAGTAAS
jgi:uncharacterized protein